MSKNVLIWIDGNLAYDPQLRQVGTKNVCNFTVATSVGTKKEDGTTNTNFFECSAWSKNGEWLFSKMQKTTGVTVFGTFEAVEVVNPATGEKRIKNRVNAISVKLRTNLRDTVKPSELDSDGTITIENLDEEDPTE